MSAIISSTVQGIEGFDKELRTPVADTVTFVLIDTCSHFTDLHLIRRCK